MTQENQQMTLIEMSQEEQLKNSIANPTYSKVNVSVYEANFCPTLKELDFKQSETELIVLLTEWRNMLGIKEQMTESDLSFCCGFIRDAYPFFSPQMIRLAIKHSLIGDLKVDVSTYGSFSPLYISKILNAYKTYSNEIYHKVESEKKKKFKPKEVQLTAYEKRMDYLQKFQDLFKNGGSMPDINGIMWDFLVKNGFIKSEIPSEIQAKVKEQKLDGENFGQWIQLSIEDQAKQAQKMVMQEFFKSNTVDFTKYEII